jgi:cathepsin L
MQKYKKSYHHEEFQARYAVFRTNMDFIEAHNSGNSTFSVDMNQFGDLTNEEFKRTYLGSRYTHTGELITEDLPEGLPTSWDWRPKGAVTAIKNQQQCGSCYSFSTTGSVEGCHFQATHKLVSLSEQNIMDCSNNYGNMGCNGGLMTNVNYLLTI